MNFIYPDLKNHDCVKQYPDVGCVASNLFFFDHKFPEAQQESMQSKFNQTEAELIVEFTKYLLLNKYKSHQITILSLYSGQLIKIKQLI
jgi:superfamily I DNA and/or RNA helicase